MVFIRDAVKMRRRRWWSLPVKIEGDPLNTQHAKEAVFIRDSVTNEDPPNRKRRRLSLFVKQSQMRIRPMRIRRNTVPNHGCNECVASVHP